MAKRNGFLTTEDKELLAELLDPGILTKDRRGYVEQTARELRSREASGCSSSERIVFGMLCDGLYTALGRHAKSDSGVFRDVSTGQALNVPKVGGVAVRDEDGAITGIRQLKLWLDMDRLEFLTWFEQQRHHAESLQLKIRGLIRILTLWDKHPDAMTPRDVCERAGIDPDEFEFGSGSIEGIAA